MLFMLSVIYAECRKQAHYAECHVSFTVMLNVIMLSVVMLSVIYAECRKQTHYAECHNVECFLLCVVAPTQCKMTVYL